MASDDIDIANSGKNQWIFQYLYMIPSLLRVVGLMKSILLLFLVLLAGILYDGNPEPPAHRVETDGSKLGCGRRQGAG